MNIEVTFVGYFVILLIYNVESECPLHTCFNCTVFCANANPTLYSEQSTESECVNLLTNASIRSVEYNSKSQCFTSDGICMTYKIERLGGIAFTNRCTQGCTTYALSGKTNLMVYDDSFISYPLLFDTCIEYSIRLNFFVFDALSLNNTCRLYDVCGIDYSCTYKQAPIYGVMTLTRTCIIPCDPPIEPMNGFAEFQSGTTLIYGAVVWYVCYKGYLLEGPTHSTCGVDGMWLPDAPLCLPISRTEKSASVSSAPETTGTTTTATTELSPTTTTTTEVISTTASAISELSPTTSTTATEVISTTATATSEISPIYSTTPTKVISPLSKKTRSPVVITPIYICPCLCNTVKWSNMTSEDIIFELIQDNTIDPKHTTSAKSKLLSKPDSRLSAKIIGVSGAAILCSCIVVFISCDVLKYVFKWNVIVKKKK